MVNHILNLELVNIVDYLAIAAMVIAAILAVILLKTKKELLNEVDKANQQIESCKLLIDSALSQLSQVDENVKNIHTGTELKQTELEQVSKQLEHRVKVLTEESASQKSNLIAIQSQQPEDRLYSRALKLVKLGASVEEIMKECDLPRAEAEILLAIHDKKH